MATTQDLCALVYTAHTRLVTHPSPKADFDEEPRVIRVTIARHVSTGVEPAIQRMKLNLCFAGAADLHA